MSSFKLFVYQIIAIITFITIITINIHNYDSNGDNGAVMQNRMWAQNHQQQEYKGQITREWTDKRLVLIIIHLVSCTSFAANRIIAGSRIRSLLFMMEHSI